MKIKCGRYTYECDLEVKVGDVVLVSVSPAWQDTFGKTAERLVTEIGSDYQGPCERVLEIIDQV